MTKPETYPIDVPNTPQPDNDSHNSITEPLSGSKKVKNQNHTGQRHGEGS